nr:hypothetical protein [Candidatus Ruthia endofausta]
MTTFDGLFVSGEANFSDHDANRFGVSALMQGLADGYFILPQTIANYLARKKFDKIKPNHEKLQQALNAAKVRIEQLMKLKHCN